MSAYSSMEPSTDGASVAVMKSALQYLHEHGKCPADCVFCTPPIGSEVHGSLSSPDANTAPTSSASFRPDSLDTQLIVHTIKVLRQWDERGLAMDLSNAVLRHNPMQAPAVAWGWDD